MRKVTCFEVKILKIKHFYIISGLVYHIYRNEEDNTFKGLAMTFPKVQEEKGLRNIRGLDAATLKDIRIHQQSETTSSIPSSILQFIGAQGWLNFSGTEEALEKYTVSIISARDQDNHTVLLSMSFGLGETIEVASRNFRVLKEANMDQNRSDLLFTLDRGSALITSIDDEAPLVSQLYCAIHLVRNLEARGWKAFLSLFWLARNTLSKAKSDNYLRGKILFLTYSYFPPCIFAILRVKLLKYK